MRTTKKKLMTTAVGVLALGWIGCQQASFAQSTFSTLIGTVVDATQAVVPGATVTVTNKGTSAVRTTTTNGVGNYAVANLEAGDYQVAMEAGGFRKTVFQSVALRARETIRLDTQLAVSEANTETVTVTVSAGVTTETPTIAVTKSNRELLELPVPFRASGTTSPISTLTTQPGVQIDNSGNLSLAGSQRYSTTVSIDGISTVSVRNNGPINELFPSVESIAEIRVSQINNNAEFAQSGDITTISKSGGNEFHGAAFWYHQNRSLDAANPFAPVNAVTRLRAKPFKVANNFGLTAGGPVRLPGYNGKDKTFFFATWEAGRLRQQSTRTYSVPPAAWRNGDFSGLAAAVRDPATGAQFPGNRIPVNRISDVSRKALDLFYPQPNTGSPNSPSNNLTALYSAPTDSDQFDVRIDHNLTERHSIFGRYNWKDISASSYEDGVLPTIGAIRRPQKVWAFTGASNYVVRANLLNEIRGGFTGRDASKDFDLLGADVVRQLGIQGLRTDLPASPGAPSIVISGLTPTSVSRGFTTTDRTWQLIDNVTWMKSRHSIKFGADIRRLSTTDLLTFTPGDDFGDYTFDGTVTNAPVGHPFAAFLLGVPDLTRIVKTGPDIAGSVWHQGYYIQDDWKVTPRLTLNLGLRYELHPPFSERTANIANFDRRATNGDVLVAHEQARRAASAGFVASLGSSKILTAAEAGVPERLRRTDYNNFAPRFGFAFRPFNNTKSVIRGGYGIYTVTILGSVFYSMTGVHSSEARTFSNSFNANRVPAFQFPLPFSTTQGGVPNAGSQDFRTGNQPDYADPYNQQWSLTLEHELRPDTALRLTYNGQHTVKLSISTELNQIPANTVGFAAAYPQRPFPNWNIIFSRDNGAISNFHGLTAELNHRFHRGLQFTSSYAWSKNLANGEGSAPGGFGGESGNRVLDRFNLRGDYGNVAFTRRHRSLTTLIWELPVGKGRTYLNNTHGAVDALLGGWQVSGIALFQTGPFLTPTVSGGDPSGTGAARRATPQRPDKVGDALPSGGSTAGQWFNRAGFICPGRSPGDPEALRYNCNIASPIGRFGYASVGSLVGPGTNSFSMALAKRFSLTERTGLRFEAQFANVFNHLNLGVPGLNVTTTAFGQVTATQAVEGAGPRVIQAGLRLSF